MKRTSCELAALLLLALPLVSPPAAAAVYRCADAGGKVTYQAQPCPDANGARLVSGDPPPVRPSPAPPRPSGSEAWGITAADGEVAAPADRPTPQVRRTVERLERLEAPRVRMSFDLLSIEGRRLPWTNTGPKDAGRHAGIVRDGSILGDGGGPAVLHENGREGYTLTGSDLAWMPKGFGGPTQELRPPTSLPALSWASAMAWDTRNGVLAIASQGGEGYFYRYDTRRHAWLGAVSLRDHDLLSLTFDTATGNYVGISDALDLLVFSSRGELQAVKPLAGQLPATAYDRANPLSAALTVMARDGVVAIVKVSKATVTHIWTYELASSRAQLTYKD